MGINLKTYFIFGFPEETKMDMQKTYNLIDFFVKKSKRFQVSFRVSVFQFRPYHGTRFYFDLFNEGQFLHNLHVVEDSLLSDKIKRTQFNFIAGNFSNCKQEIVSMYIQESLVLNNLEIGMVNKKDKKIDVMWVGLSHKKEKDGKKFFPLSADTNSGKIILEIEKLLPRLNFHRTNLVKSAPVDKDNKLRYPTMSEMDNDYLLLQKEIDELSPKLVFLLGSKVSNFVLKKNKKKLTKTQKNWQSHEDTIINGVYFVSIFHPSYVYVYKRKYISEYTDAVRRMISDLLIV